MNAMHAQNFELLVDGVPYLIKATPYDFNGQLRFTVSYNGSEDYIFTRDAEAGQLTAIGTDVLDIPDNLEQAISEKLSSITE